MKKYLLVFALTAVVLSVFSAIPARAAGVCPNYFATQLSVGDKDGEDGRARGGADLRGLTAVAEMQQFLKTQGVATAIPNRELGNFGNGSTLSALNAWQNKLTVNSAESLAGTPVGQRYWGPKSIIVANRLKCGTTDALPPLVAFSYPTTAATYATTAAQTILAVTARDNVGVASLSWTSNRKNNGLMQGVTTNYPANTGAGLGLSQIWNGPNEIVHLLPGLNTITVTATDAASNRRAAVLNITRNTGATPVNGVCDSANGVAVASAPIANLCSVGTPTAVSFSSFGNYWWWKCRGTGMNSLTPTCRARKLPSTPDRTPPTVNITYPTINGSYATNSPTVTLKGTAAGIAGKGISQVRWFVDSNPTAEHVAVGLTNWSATVSLTAGTNVIRVRAIDTAGRDSYDNITINYGTDNTACFDLPRNLYQNDGTVNGTDQKSNDVRFLQQYLISHGFLATKYEEGSFGPSTMAALAAWQQARGLTEKDSRNRSHWGPLSQAKARANCTAPVAGAPVISSFTVNKANVAAGVPVTFLWSVTNFDSCKLSDSSEWSVTPPPHIKTLSVAPTAGQTTTYTLECRKGNLRTSAVPIAITVAALSNQTSLPDLIIRPAFSNRTGNRVPNGMGLTVSSGLRATAAVQNVKVQWYIDGVPIQKKVGVVPSVPASSAWQVGAQTGGLTDIYLPWNILTIFDLNTPHTLKMVVDPDNTIAESNEGNNETTLTYTVAPASTVYNQSAIDQMAGVLRALQELINGLR